MAASDASKRPMRNPLQEQLLKAGLVKKNQVAQTVREQAKKHKGKQPAAPSTEQLEAQRWQAGKCCLSRRLVRYLSSGRTGRWSPLATSIVVGSPSWWMTGQSAGAAQWGRLPTLTSKPGGKPATAPASGAASDG